MGARYFYAIQNLDNKLHRYHRRHLVPVWLIRPICNHYEALLLASGNGPSDASAESGTVLSSDEEFLTWLERERQP